MTTTPKPKTVDDLPDPNGPGTIPVSPEAHKLVQTNEHADPHRRSGDANTENKSGT